MRFFALILFISIPSFASETLSQLESDARLLVLDSTSTTRQRFSTAQVDTFLNQGMRYAVSLDNCLQQNIVFNLTPGTTYYALPNNYENILRVTIGYKYIPQQTPAALDGKSRGWESASGYPTYYFINFTSRSLVGFAPWPAQASDTDTVKVEFSIAPTDMALSGDLPFNGINELQVYDHMLAYYAASQMAAVDGRLDQAKAYMDIFTANLSTFEKGCLANPSYLPSAVATP